MVDDDDDGDNDDDTSRTTRTEQNREGDCGVWGSEQTMTARLGG